MTTLRRISPPVRRPLSLSPTQGWSHSVWLVGWPCSALRSLLSLSTYSAFRATTGLSRDGRSNSPIVTPDVCSPPQLGSWCGLREQAGGKDTP